MIELAGGTDLLGAPGARSRTLTWSEVKAATPDVIIYMPCDYGLEDAVGQISALFAIDEFRRTPAALRSDVFVTDSSSHFSRSGPRLIDGVEILAGLLHPDRLSPPPPSKALRVTLYGGGYLSSVMTTNDVPVEVYRSFVEDGRSPQPTEICVRFQLSVEEVARALRELADQDVIASQFHHHALNET